MRVHTDAVSAGTHNNKVTDAAKDFVKQNVNGRVVSINLIRRILKKGALQRFYPAASVIYEYVTGEQIEKCTKEERQQMHRMHVQCVALLLRRRSKTNAATAGTSMRFRPVPTMSGAAASRR